MGAIEDIKAKGLPYQDDESGLIRLAILDLATRLDEAEKRITELELASPCPMLKSICEDWEYDAKPAPEDAEPRTCHDCKYYAGGLCHAYSRQVSADAHICNGFKPAPEDAPLPHHGYTIEVPVYVDGMMQVWVPMPEGCAVPRVFIGHASWFKGWRESK